MRGKLITANRLKDGEVVYLTAGGSWSGSLSDARFLADETLQDRLLRIAEQDVAGQIVVGPYLMDAETENASIQPVSQRERIRANGPTVRASFQQPAGQE